MSEKNGKSVNTYAINGFKNEDNQLKNHANLTVLSATVFIVGEVAGVGILSLPNAVAGAGWLGIPLIILIGASAGVAGVCLGKSWVILEERYPKYRETLTRKPFAAIGQRAFGPWMGVTLSVVMGVTRFGSSCVILLLISNLLKNLTHNFISFGICSWAPIIGATLTPLMWLGSPADFWPVAYTAMGSTVLGSILLIVNMIIERDNIRTAEYTLPSFSSFSLSYGNVIFAFGGASAFPNFQNDMIEKDKFPKAVTFGFIGLLLLYIPVSAGGYAIYGERVPTNIIDIMGESPLTVIIDILFLIHAYFAYLIVVNPIVLDFEEVIKIPKTFNWKRVVFRTLLMIGIIFVSESVPTYGRILDLMGGSTFTFMAFIMPPIFYYKLCSQKSDDWPQRTIPLHFKCVLFAIPVIGLIGGFASTYSSIASFASPDSNLEPPCYAGRTNNTYF